MPDMQYLDLNTPACAGFVRVCLQKSDDVRPTATEACAFLEQLHAALAAPLTAGEASGLAQVHVALDVMDSQEAGVPPAPARGCIGLANTD